MTKPVARRSAAGDSPFVGGGSTSAAAVAHRVAAAEKAIESCMRRQEQRWSAKWARKLLRSRLSLTSRSVCDRVEDIGWKGVEERQRDYCAVQLAKLFGSSSSREMSKARGC